MNDQPRAPSCICVFKLVVDRYRRILSRSLSTRSVVRSRSLSTHSVVRSRSLSTRSVVRSRSLSTRSVVRSRSLSTRAATPRFPQSIAGTSGCRLCAHDGLIDVGLCCVERARWAATSSCTRMLGDQRRVVRLVRADCADQRRRSLFGMSLIRSIASSISDDVMRGGNDRRTVARACCGVRPSERSAGEGSGASALHAAPKPTQTAVASRAMRRASPSTS
jgi:hypothetical protein